MEFDKKVIDENKVLNTLNKRQNLLTTMVRFGTESHRIPMPFKNQVQKPDLLPLLDVNLRKLQFKKDIISYSFKHDIKTDDIKLNYSRQAEERFKDYWSIMQAWEKKAKKHKFKISASKEEMD